MKTLNGATFFRQLKIKLEVKVHFDNRKTWTEILKRNHMSDDSFEITVNSGPNKVDYDEYRS